ncbi:hypothetical protein [Streptomyces sp. SP18CS02]|uniref:hypothetical protein n=1 Tax=Streptomyces sp. SP18CS02 TaxID=3002531 RepID=UPI002E782ECF|nr:hypothetical protein [Streptomyces sp. SP18CS02]MEE1756228.1 hypothetical protein [Streptomyces sp. SP18CS02]
MARRPIALTAALVLLGEAVGIALIHLVLATVVDSQRMSLAGVDPGLMITGTWVMGGVFALFLVLCAAALVRAAWRDRAPGRPGRVLLISCAIVHGVLGALAVGLVGWPAFAFMMAVLALLVLALLVYAPETGTEAAPPEGGVPAGPAAGSVSAAPYGRPAGEGATPV